MQLFISKTKPKPSKLSMMQYFKILLSINSHTQKGINTTSARGMSNCIIYEVLANVYFLRFPHALINFENSQVNFFIQLQANHDISALFFIGNSRLRACAVLSKMFQMQLRLNVKGSSFYPSLSLYRVRVSIFGPLIEMWLLHKTAPNRFYSSNELGFVSSMKD